MLDAGSIGINTTNPDQYYIQCKMWWRKWKPTFKAWFDTLDIEYHPEWNLDYHEASHDFTDQVGTSDTITKNKEIMDDDTTGSLTSKEITDNDTTENNTITEVVDAEGTSTSSETKNVNGSSNTSTTHDVSAFDSEWVTDPVTGNLVPQYQPEWRENENKSYNEGTTDNINGSTTEDRTTTTTEKKTGTDDTTTDVTQSTAGTDDRTTTFDGNVDNDTTQKTDYTHDMFRNGNYGTTSTQDLLTQELKLRFFNTYEHIAQIFIKEMTCAVW